MPGKKNGPAIRKVGIVIKQKVTEANTLALEAAAYLKKRDVAVAFASESQDVCLLATGTTCESKDELIRTCDLIVVFGGDGTFISIARLMAERSVPILGVNMGQLGFLTEFKKTEVHGGLEAALAGKLQTSERMMLECTLRRGDRTIVQIPVVNDVVITKGEIARIFDLEVSIDAKPVTTMKGDGLIIATPSGSTAYCLAAGGPILEPSVPAIAMVAICPHSLTLRPLILHDSSKITLIPQFKGGRVILTLDGQASYEIELGDTILVTRHEKHPLKILCSPQRDYFSLLREKLKYGYRT
ncbi:MAG: NAD(+)/NADH kinase [Deltaproteobacteria bacterium]|nr:NAD(+)/NADH kinase [Deltaproteobacteria bacterium]